MKYYAIPAFELKQDLISRWNEIQISVNSLANPYFRPEFTQTVAAVRKDVFIGLIEQNSKIVGFFPYHRNRWGIARPLALGLSDYHGVIAEPNIDWTFEGLLGGCNIIRFEYDHVLADQHQLSAYHTKVSDSPIIDLSQGIDAFKESRDKSGRKYIAEVLRKRQKLEEQLGNVYYTEHSKNSDILHQLIAWKSAQCKRTGTVDYFSIDWCVILIQNIFHIHEPEFGGILSCLHAGDALVAIHFVMYSKKVWHSWFPAYNHDFDEYSPGSILLLEMIKTASMHGIKYIDLGKGLSLYKKRVMTGSISVAEGCVEMPSLYNNLKFIRTKIEQYSRNTIFSSLLRVPGRFIKQMERKGRYL